MKYTELMEGAEPKLPGAPKGIQIMTPQQFVTKSAGEEEKLDELSPETLASYKKKAGMEASKLDKQAFANDVFAKQKIEKANKRFSGIVRATNKEFSKSQQGVAEGLEDAGIQDAIIDTVERLFYKNNLNDYNSLEAIRQGVKHHFSKSGAAAESAIEGILNILDKRMRKSGNYLDLSRFKEALRQGVAHQLKKRGVAENSIQQVKKLKQNASIEESIVDTHTLKNLYHTLYLKFGGGGPVPNQQAKDAAYTEIEKQYGTYALDRLKRSHRIIAVQRDGNVKKYGAYPNNKDVAEATKLAAPTRPFGDQELTDYLDRIRKQEKAKTDKYKLPYIHRSSVMGYYNEEGQKYNVDAIKSALAQRPKSLLKKNEKMKHSDGELEQFFNIGFAALVGVALDENTNEIIIVNTCPGAGSCKIDCFAMKGGKIQFQGPWLSDGRILTYLLNDPTGFFTQLKNEITKEYNKGKKEGYSVSIRWHDAGDFFSPEYASMAFKLAEELPNVNFYAYTKVADVAVGKKPSNFMINWSEGASTAQEKKVKQLDPNLEQTKNSRIVPNNLFYDLLVKDEKKNLVKGPEGQWQVIPDKIPELKDRLSKAYNISKNSILTYSEYESKVKGKDKSPLKYNVIITPGEPDVTAKDPGVLSTLLLKH